MIIECVRCEALTDHEEKSSLRRPYEGSSLETVYTLLMCKACSEVALVAQDWAGDETIEPYRLYPPIEKQLSSDVPKELRSSYEEAVKCFKAKAYIAAAVMCRKTLEGLCYLHQADGRNLATSLRKLHSDGVIDRSLYDWANALRITGNEAAHGVTFRLARQDSKDILGFSEAILDYVYTYKARFDAFMERKRNRGADSAG